MAPSGLTNCPLILDANPSARPLHPPSQYPSVKKRSIPHLGRAMSHIVSAPAQPCRREGDPERNRYAFGEQPASHRGQGGAGGQDVVEQYHRGGVGDVT